VDVILTYEQETMEGTTTRSFHTSRTILENVRVLAVDQTSAADGDEQTIIGSTVTMELSVEEAEALALGEAIGEVTLALRSVADMAGALPGEYGRPRADKGFAQTVTNTVTVVRNGVATRVNSGGN
jgi:pilus assembly protein CpaB